MELVTAVLFERTFSNGANEQDEEQEEATSLAGVVVAEEVLEMQGEEESGRGPRSFAPFSCRRHDGNTARLARKSDEALGVRVSVARIAASLLDPVHTLRIEHCAPFQKLALSGDGAFDARGSVALISPGRRKPVHLHRLDLAELHAARCNIRHPGSRGRGGVMVRLLASHLGEPCSIPDGAPDFRMPATAKEVFSSSQTHMEQFLIAVANFAGRTRAFAFVKIYAGGGSDIFQISEVQFRRESKAPVSSRASTETRISLLALPSHGASWRLMGSATLLLRCVLLARGHRTAGHAALVCRLRLARRHTTDVELFSIHRYQLFWANVTGSPFTIYAGRSSEFTFSSFIKKLRISNTLERKSNASDGCWIRVGGIRRAVRVGVCSSDVDDDATLRNAAGGSGPETFPLLLYHADGSLIHKELRAVPMCSCVCNREHNFHNGTIRFYYKEGRSFSRAPQLYNIMELLELFNKFRNRGGGRFSGRKYCGGELGKLNYLRGENEKVLDMVGEKMKQWKTSWLGRQPSRTRLQCRVTVEAYKGKLQGGEFVMLADGAAVAERLNKSPPAKANLVQSPAGPLPDLHKWESCRTMPLVGGFSRGSPVSPRPFTDSQDLACVRATADILIVMLVPSFRDVVEETVYSIHGFSDLFE
ncbi:hypothetical protein PR048_000220 [Dryococelus australis]|uniref:Uncharacterized protein n=1 Tax=Dryococelus australis TaxID=614101 RepID=A0ABQ9IE10_9NEOP|nr:hypothetical protein PR048_000220 [Dryococelus australis]